jgi:hypothetical protein
MYSSARGFGYGKALCRMYDSCEDIEVKAAAGQ